MDKLGRKDFDGWIKVKSRIHYDGKIRSFKEGEIWWSSVGENVGVEVCGKGSDCVRPVLILKKLNKYSFWAIPLTSKEHQGSWYARFGFDNREQTAMLSQVHCMSVLRLKRKIGQVPQSDYDLIMKSFLRLAYKNTP